MKNLDDEQYRVLLNRIMKIIHKARYDPASVNEHEAAHEVLRPYYHQKDTN